MNIDKATQEKLDIIKNHGYFQELQRIDRQIKESKDPFDLRFYLSMQDQLNNIFGELTITYGEINADYSRYMAQRKVELMIEAETNQQLTVGGGIIPTAGKRLPGNEMLEDLIKAEVGTTLAGLIMLKHWIERSVNSIRTCRSHIYPASQDTKEIDPIAKC